MAPLQVLLQEMIRKKDTILRVAEPAQLMDFLIAKMGGMARSSVKQLLGQRRVKVGNDIPGLEHEIMTCLDSVTHFDTPLAKELLDRRTCHASHLSDEKVH